MERGLTSAPPELVPHSGCGSPQPPRPLQRGLRQEGIFGRFWYHNLSFAKENTGWGAQGQSELKAPSAPAPQPGQAWARTPKGYCKF